MSDEHRAAVLGGGDRSGLDVGDPPMQLLLPYNFS
jgi:hypothetical protein